MVREERSPSSPSTTLCPDRSALPARRKPRERAAAAGARRGLTSRWAPGRRGSPCSPAWWCSARSPARHKAPRPQRQPRPLPHGPGAAPAPLTPSPCSAARYSPATISPCSSRNSASSAITGAAAPSGRARTPAGAPGRDGAAQQCRPGRLSPPRKRWEKGCSVKALQSARTRAARGAQSLSEGRSREPNPPRLRTCPAHPTAGARRGARVSLPSRQRPCLPLPAAGSHGATWAGAGVERGLKPRRRPGRDA